MRLRKMLLALIAGVVACGVGLWVYGPITFAISQDQIQAQIDAKLPITGEKAGIAYLVEHAQITLVEGRLRLDSVVELTHDDMLLRATSRAWTEIVYRDGGFYLAHLQPESVELSSTPQTQERLGRWRDRAQRLTQTLGVEEQAQAFAEQKRAQIIAILQTSVLHAIQQRLDHAPVYRLDDDKTSHAGAKLFLDRVEVGQGQLLITLNLLKGSLRLAMIGLGFVFSCLLALGFVVSLLGLLASPCVRNWRF